MPELPEVETVRRGLEANVVGRRIERVEVGRLRTVRRTSAQAVVNGLTGTTVLAAGRRGKYLICALDSGDSVMIHLRMTGQLLLSARGTARPAHTHVVMHLAADERRGVGPHELWFVDARTFGEVVVFDPDHVADEVPELAALGLDPIADRFDASDLHAVLSRRATALKPLLLDQHVVAGIGNIYADEILHASRLHPDLPANLLRRADSRRLHESMQRILTGAIRAGGSTLRDNKYVDLMGSGGSYQHEHAVYGRGGERCATCGRGVVRRVVRGGRSTHFCPVCQRRRGATLPGRGSPPAPGPSR